MFFTNQEIEAVLLQVVDKFLIPRFNQLGMNATGEWLNSLGVIGDNQAGIIIGRDYTQYLVHGSKPHTAPIKPLIRWAMGKFGVDEKRAKSIAFAVRSKIEKRGTSWYEQGGSDLLEVLEEPQVIDFITQEMSAIAQVRIAEQLRRNAIEALT